MPEQTDSKGNWRMIFTENKNERLFYIPKKI